MNLNKILYRKTIEEVSKNFKLLKSSDVHSQIENALKLILNALKKKNKIIFCGNGGSAADAQHLAAELLGGYLKKNRKPIKAICLNTNTSTITAISNDYDYKYIFSRQLKALSSKGDVLFCISTSGSSKNILEVLKTAKKIGIKSILLTGRRKRNTKLLDLQINVPANRVDRIQEMHIFVGHLICEILEKKLT